MTDLPACAPLSAPFLPMLSAVSRRTAMSASPTRAICYSALTRH